MPTLYKGLTKKAVIINSIGDHRLPDQSGDGLGALPQRCRTEMLKTKYL